MVFPVRPGGFPARFPARFPVRFPIRAPSLELRPVRNPFHVVTWHTHG